jgi:N-acetyl-anhydromuramyl-L-alanine amidase AmpD
MPTLNTLIAGRSDLPGPLCHLGLGRDGTYYVVAAGRANHAGGGIWDKVGDGNSRYIGIEAEHSGRSDEPWPPVQRDAYVRGVAALLKYMGKDAGRCCGHGEYALPSGRKNDPILAMPEFRRDVQAALDGSFEARPIIPSEDAKQRRTIRRGDRGDDVRALQKRLGIGADGIFGPGTEAAVRRLQRDRSLVPDGIVGPKTWQALDPA